MLIRPLTRTSTPIRAGNPSKTFIFAIPTFENPMQGVKLQIVLMCPNAKMCNPLECPVTRTFILNKNSCIRSEKT